MTKSYHNDSPNWDRRHEAYADSPNIYVPIPKPAPKAGKQGYWLSIRAEERMGSLIAAGGMIWAAHVATVDYAGLWRMKIMPPGPMEVCILGVLAWLHAKWRRSTKVD